MFFSFLLVIHFLKRLLLYDNLDHTLNSPFLLYLLQAWNHYVFSHFLMFSKNWFIHQVGKSFLKSFFTFFLFPLFILMYGFGKAFWRNLMALCSFCDTILWFNTCFKFFMWITYSYSSGKFATSFATFSIPILSGKEGNHCECLQSSRRVKINFKKVLFITFFIVVFFWHFY